jgi:hypothetical protein
VAVVVTKALLIGSLFWVYGFLLQLPLAVFLFVLKASAAAIYVVLQRPLSSGKRISRAMVSGGLTSVHLLLWVSVFSWAASLFCVTYLW